MVHWLFLFHTWLILKTNTDLHVNTTLGVGVIQSCLAMAAKYFCILLKPGNGRSLCHVHLLLNT